MGSIKGIGRLLIPSCFYNEFNLLGLSDGVNGSRADTRILVLRLLDGTWEKHLRPLLIVSTTNYFNRCASPTPPRELAPHLLDGSPRQAAPETPHWHHPVRTGAHTDTHIC